MFWRVFNTGNGINKYLRDDAYALVTGSSDGVGKGVAEELLSRGFNVILHGRNPDKLKTLKDDLATRHPERDVRYIVADGSEVSKEQMDEILRQIEGKKITVLINNMAWVGGEYDLLEETSYEVAEVAINVNVRFFTHLTRVMLPTLHANEPSLLMNVSSIGGRYALGYLSLYVAGKAYLNALSRSLIQEFQFENKKIEVLVVELHNTQSSTNKAPESFSTPSTKVASKKIVDAVGHGGSSGFVIPYIGHELTSWSVCLLPQSMVEKLGTQAVVKDLKQGK